MPDLLQYFEEHLFLLRGRGVQDVEPPPCRSIFSMFVLPKNMFSLAHAEMAGNIPLLFVKHDWNAETNQSAVESKPDIITEARRQFKPADTILVMCRSGDRGAMAVNALA